MVRNSRGLSLFAGLLSLLTLLPARPAQADRGTVSLPLVARSYQWTGGGMTGAGGYLELSFTNLSKVSQTLTIKVMDETMENSISIPSCGCSCPGITWPAQGASCWLIKKMTYPSPGRPEQSITIDAESSKEIILQWNCKWRKSGPDCGSAVTVDDIHTTEIVSATGAGMINAASVNYRARVSVSVKEDRGAVIGRASLGLGIVNAVNQISNPMDYLLNGGRPF